MERGQLIGMWLDGQLQIAETDLIAADLLQENFERCVFLLPAGLKKLVGVVVYGESLIAGVGEVKTQFGFVEDVPAAFGMRTVAAAEGRARNRELNAEWVVGIWRGRRDERRRRGWIRCIELVGSRLQRNFKLAAGGVCAANLL